LWPMNLWTLLGNMHNPTSGSLTRARLRKPGARVAGPLSVCVPRGAWMPGPGGVTVKVVPLPY
jgi:hypothetical protein